MGEAQASEQKLCLDRKSVLASVWTVLMVLRYRDCLQRATFALV
jgi:hypothetical protein